MKRNAAAFFVILSIGALLLLSACGGAASPSVTPDPTAAPATPTAAPAPTPEPTPMTATICACGDIVPHYPLVEDAREEDDYDFVRCFDTETAVEIAGADYAFCTLESAVRPEIALHYYPQFNTPEEILRDLKAVGFDLICLASNHCADMRFEGIVDTIDACERQGLDHTGTYRTREEREADRGILFRDINGIRFAILDYTTITNQYKLTGTEWAVRCFYEDFWSLNPKIILFDEIAADIQAAKDAGADVLLAVCHWGTEYRVKPVEHQELLADFLLENGVDIIIGSHPHVPQPAESRIITEPDGTERRAYIFYSLGNFLTGMDNPAGDVMPCVHMSFSKDPVSGETEIVSVEYTPFYRATLPRGGDRTYQVWNMDKSIASWEAGEADIALMPEFLYKKTLSRRTQLLEIVGTELYAGAE